MSITNQSPETYSPSLIEAIERAYEAVWSTLSAHMSSDRYQSHELKVVLSQTLVALAANRTTDSQVLSPQGHRDNGAPAVTTSPKLPRPTANRCCGSGRVGEGRGRARAHHEGSWY